MTRHYKVMGDRHANVAGYALAVLEDIAEGALETGEAPADYAQRHLREMVELGHITERVTS